MSARILSDVGRLISVEPRHVFYYSEAKQISQPHLWFPVMVIVVPSLSLVAHVPDAWVGVLGGASRTIASIIYGCVTSPGLSWLMWLGKVYNEYCIILMVYSYTFFSVMYC